MFHTSSWLNTSEAHFEFLLKKAKVRLYQMLYLLCIINKVELVIWVCHMDSEVFKRRLVYCVVVFRLKITWYRCQNSFISSI